MITADYVFIGIIVVSALLGYILGFGRSLKIATKGIFGVIISLAVCFMFGGTLRNISAVKDLIVSVDNYFADLWSFLGYLHLGTVIYYVCLFFVVQLLRIIIVKITIGITGINNGGMRFVSKSLGLVFLAAFCFGLCLLGLAVLKRFEDSEFVLDILSKLENGLLFKLYDNNPIKL